MRIFVPSLLAYVYAIYLSLIIAIYVIILFARDRCQCSPTRGFGRHFLKKNEKGFVMDLISCEIARQQTHNGPFTNEMKQ